MSRRHAAATADPARHALHALLVLATFATASCATRPVPGPGQATAERSAPQPTPLAERRVPDPRNVVYDPTLFEGLEWDWVGPARGGRVTAVSGVVGQPGTYYMGSTGGGVWKTADYGESWTNLSDGWFETPSIGAVRVAPSDPNVVWVTTGSDGLRSNVITGLGVYRSTDAGETWRFLGLRETGNTGAVEVDPRDADVAFVAAIGHPFGPNPERGLYRTRDGGESWERVLFISDSTGIADVEIDPSDPDVIYASTWRGERRPWTIISGARGEGGIYRSTDGGDTWRKLGGGLPTGPDDLFGKTDLALSRSNPATVYALIEAPEPRDGLYRSDDGGETWEHVSSHDPLLSRPFYFTNVDVDPRDPDVVWVGAVLKWKSTDGGRSWERIQTPHADNHDLWIDPDDTDLMVQGNDGGATVTRDGGRTWSTLYNQPTAEMYSIRTDDRVAYWVFGGQQDWDIVGVPTLPSPRGDWINYGGGTCETGPAVPRPEDDDVVYNSCKGRFMVWDWRTGQLRHHYVSGVYMYGHAAGDLPYRFQRVAPVEVSPHDPSVIYHGSQYVHRTRDAGITWETISPDLTAQPPGTQGISGEPITRDITGEEVYSTLYAIEESPLERGVIWAGSYDGLVHVTRDDGGTWTDVTPADLPAGGRVQAIHASHHAPGTAYASVLRFMLDDWSPYVYRTTDFGRSWTRLTDGRNGIPADYPVRVVREDPVRPGLLFAGAEFGMYVSFDDGRHWQPLQLDLPVTPVTDIEVKDGDLVVSTMGRGFWVLRDLTPLRRLTADVAATPAHFHRPAPAVRMDYRPSGGRSAVDPDYPRPGAVLDWVFAAEPEGPVTVELLRADGAVINSWMSEEDPAEAGATDGGPAGTPAAAAGAERAGSGGPAVPRQAGHTRFRAPLEHPAPWAAPGSRGGWGGGGPALAPGDYRVRLTTGDWSVTHPLRVELDPRVGSVGVTAADLREQERVALRARDLLSRARQLAHAVEEELETIAGADGDPAGAGARAPDPDRMAGEDAGGGAGRGRDPARGEVAGSAPAAPADPERHDRLQRAHALLITETGISYPQPMLVDQIQYLYGMVTRAAQHPGHEAERRYAELLAELEAVEAMLADAEPAEPGGG